VSIRPEDQPYDAGSRAEAVAADVHHHHHPDDGNAPVVRGRLGRGVVVAALVATAVTVAGVVLLAIAVGKA
jgi:hypothetical protein